MGSASSVAHAPAHPQDGVEFVGVSPGPLPGTRNASFRCLTAQEIHNSSQTKNCELPWWKRGVVVCSSFADSPCSRGSRGSLGSHGSRRSRFSRDSSRDSSSSRRSGKDSFRIAASNRTATSVRQLALEHLSRHENSYISANRATADLHSTSKRFVASQRNAGSNRIGQKSATPSLRTQDVTNSIRSSINVQPSLPITLALPMTQASLNLIHGETPMTPHHAAAALVYTTLTMGVANIVGDCSSTLDYSATAANASGLSGNRPGMFPRLSIDCKDDNGGEVPTVCVGGDDELQVIQEDDHVAAVNRAAAALTRATVRAHNCDGNITKGYDLDADFGAADSGLGLSSTFGNAVRQRMLLKLSISTGPEQELSDDEDLYEFDSRRHEIPREFCVGTEGENSGRTATTLERTESSSTVTRSCRAIGKLQIHDSGFLTVDGLNVNDQGILRSDPGESSGGETRRSAKLPMRRRLVFLCKLGSGASSVVYKALDLQDMRLVAVKMIILQDKDKRLQMVRELTALFQFIKENSRRDFSSRRNVYSGRDISSRHNAANARPDRPDKYIVDFYDAFVDEGVVCFMIEYMDGGSLQDIVDSGGCTDEPTLANIAVQVLKGIAFLHVSNQIHRDLKPGNFLISHRGEVKVADLGILKQMPNHGPPSLQRTNSFVGTAAFMSPERIDGRDYSYPADVWAIGLSLISLANGGLPNNIGGGYWTVLSVIRDHPSPSLPSGFSPEFNDFISKCMRRNPEDRSTCAQLLNHKFLSKVVREDLTYHQSDARGVQELISILEATFIHITQICRDIHDRYDSAEAFEASVSAIHNKVFGNVWTNSPTVVLKHVFLPQSDNNTTASRRSKRRLTSLSKQLHLTYEKVYSETQSFCDAKCSSNTSTQ